MTIVRLTVNAIRKLVIPQKVTDVPVPNNPNSVLTDDLGNTLTDDLGNPLFAA